MGKRAAISVTATCILSEQGMKLWGEEICLWVQRIYKIIEWILIKNHLTKSFYMQVNLQSEELYSNTSCIIMFDFRLTSTNRTCYLTDIFSIVSTRHFYSTTATNRGYTAETTSTWKCVTSNTVTYISKATHCTDVTTSTSQSKSVLGREKIKWSQALNWTH